MLDGEPPGHSVLFDDMHRAPVGEGGYREARHAGQGLVVVQGGGDHGARLDEKALRLLVPAVLGLVPEVHREPLPGGIGPVTHAPPVSLVSNSVVTPSSMARLILRYDSRSAV